MTPGPIWVGVRVRVRVRVRWYLAPVVVPSIERNKKFPMPMPHRRATQKTTLKVMKMSMAPRVRVRA